jgi:hypothetical protein
MDQLPLENFENNRIELWFSKILLLAPFVKSWIHVGRSVDYGKKGEFLEKGGVFEILNQFLLEWLSLCLNKCV